MSSDAPEEEFSLESAPDAQSLSQLERSDSLTADTVSKDAETSDAHRDVIDEVADSPDTDNADNAPGAHAQHEADDSGASAIGIRDYRSFSELSGSDFRGNDVSLDASANNGDSIGALVGGDNSFGLRMGSAQQYDDDVPVGMADHIREEGMSAIDLGSTMIKANDSLDMLAAPRGTSAGDDDINLDGGADGPSARREAWKLDAVQPLGDEQGAASSPSGIATGTGSSLPVESRADSMSEQQLREATLPTAGQSAIKASVKEEAATSAGFEGVGGVSVPVPEPTVAEYPRSAEADNYTDAGGEKRKPLPMSASREDLHAAQKQARPASPAVPAAASPYASTTPSVDDSGRDAHARPPSGMDHVTEGERARAVTPPSPAHAAQLALTRESHPAAAAAAIAAAEGKKASLDGLGSAVFANGEQRKSSQDAQSRMHSYWPVSAETATILSAVVAADSRDAVASQAFPRSNPGIVVETAQGDPVRELIARYFGDAEAAKRQSVQLDDITMDAKGMRELMRRGAWRSVIDLSARYLTAHGQGFDRGEDTLPVHTHKTLQMWLCRAAALMRLRMYEVVASELATFGDFDRADLFFEFYPDSYPGWTGSMVPFSLRVLHAELPIHLNMPQESLDRTYAVIETCTKVLSSLRAGRTDGMGPLDAADVTAAIALWQSRVDRLKFSVGNQLVLLKDYDLAAVLYGELLAKEPSSTPLLSGIGRMYLQLGDLKTAAAYFHKIESVGGASPHHSVLVSVNKALLLLAEGSCAKAIEVLRGALKADPGNLVIANNLSVCLLYDGNLQHAIGILENHLQNNPSQSVRENLMFNLATMFELESGRSGDRKRALIGTVASHASDGFDVECLKLAL